MSEPEGIRGGPEEDNTQPAGPRSEFHQPPESCYLVLVLLLGVPYCCVLYHSSAPWDDMHAVIAGLALNIVYLALFVVGMLLAVKAYCLRQRLLEWTVRLLYAYHADIVPPPVADFRRVAVQTLDMDLQRQADLLVDKHQGEMRRTRRHILLMKQKFRQKVRGLRDLAKASNDILTKLQLKFPDIEREKGTLVAERDAIEKQLDEERRRNKELIARFQRINQQFNRLGHVQIPGHPREYPPPLLGLDFMGPTH